MIQVVLYSILCMSMPWLYICILCISIVYSSFVYRMNYDIAFYSYFAKEMP